MNLYGIPILIPFSIFQEFVISLGLTIDINLLLTPYLLSNFFILIIYFYIFNCIYTFILYLLKLVRRKVKGRLWKM